MNILVSMNTISKHEKVISKPLVNGYKTIRFLLVTAYYLNYGQLLQSVTTIFTIKSFGRFYPKGLTVISDTYPDEDIDKAACSRVSRKSQEWRKNLEPSF